MDVRASTPGTFAPLFHVCGYVDASYVNEYNKLMKTHGSALSFKKTKDKAQQVTLGSFCSPKTKNEPLVSWLTHPFIYPIELAKTMATYQWVGPLTFPRRG